jgi:hypothetical protein
MPKLRRKSSKIVGSRSYLYNPLKALSGAGCSALSGKSTSLLGVSSLFRVPLGGLLSGAGCSALRWVLERVLAAEEGVSV